MPDLPDDAIGGLSRRTLLGLGVGVLTLSASAAACSVDTSAAPRRRAPGPAALTHDVTVATQALAAIRLTAAGVTATSARFPGLRPAVAGLAAIHEAHARSLADAVPPQAATSGTPAPYVVPQRRPAAIAKLTAAEAHLHTTLDTLALSAQSGEFARLLAAMGAAVAQQLSELPA